MESHDYGGNMNKKGIVLFILFGFIMMQYQNCAPPAQNFDDSSSVSEADDINTGIDSVDVGGVYFPQEKVTASDEGEAVQVIGACDQTGALISWTLKSQDGSLIERGLAECDTGSFNVELSDEWKKFCDESLYLKASLGAKASSETEVEPICN
jgi:hypothetical protein